VFNLILIVVLLVVVNALYVAAEFATVAVRRIRLEAMADRGDAVARRLLPHVSDATALDRYVAACQIGITLSSLVLGAVGQGRLAALLAPPMQRWWGLDAVAANSASATLILLALTGLQVVLGELVPKAVALRFPERVALALTLPMILSLRLFSWFIALLNGSGNLVLRALGVPLHAHRHVHSPEELEQLLAHGAQAGTLQAEEHRRLKRALRFGRRQVRDVMVPRTRITALDADAEVQVLLDTVESSPYTRFPVYRDSEDTILGILHLKDLSLAMASEEGPGSLESLMRKATVFPSSMAVDAVLEGLRRERAHMAILVDEYGGTEGLVTLEDLIEEVLGEIDDEFDRARPALVRVAPGEYLVRGIVPLGELEESIGLCAGIREVHTVGGLVMHLAGRVPEPGQIVHCSGFEMKVEEMRQRQVARVRIRLEARR